MAQTYLATPPQVAQNTTSVTQTYLQQPQKEASYQRTGDQVQILDSGQPFASQNQQPQLLNQPNATSETQISAENEYKLLTTETQGPQQPPGQTPQSQTNQMMMKPQQMIVHQTFSIPMLERKMMFLNEPSLQVSQHTQHMEQIRHIWRVHYHQMQNMKPETLENPDPVKKPYAQQPSTIDEVGGPLGFSSESMRPKDYNQFQKIVYSQLDQLHRAHKDLRARFKESGVEIEKDIQRVENLTGHIQQVFNDFIACFNSFVRREERLETLHHQAIKKSRELNKKIQMEVMAQSSQRSQLLAIVDDLQGQLKQTKLSTVKTESFTAEFQAHKATKQALAAKESFIAELQQEILALKNQVQELGQDGVTHKVRMGEVQGEVNHLNGIIQDQTMQIEDLNLRRTQLEQEVSRLKSQIELTQSSKDKIILKLKQELRLQAAGGGNLSTSLNNTLQASIMHQNPNSNIALQHNHAGMPVRNQWMNPSNNNEM